MDTIYTYNALALPTLQAGEDHASTLRLIKEVQFSELVVSCMSCRFTSQVHCGPASHQL